MDHDCEGVLTWFTHYGPNTNLFCFLKNTCVQNLHGNSPYSNLCWWISTDAYNNKNTIDVTLDPSSDVTLDPSSDVTLDPSSDVTLDPSSIRLKYNSLNVILFQKGQK
ncbi:hypothetical protein CTI12_AA474180 [Artemisia annua]|uniref:Uncharacterized protein n=1 Tax=Artemisia annua TaxID=35608 RepID=A0A2U1LIK4_ARTAN|nr:hypothetical protein CTI12_AA474180 [Artemisia annua]